MNPSKPITKKEALDMFIRDRVLGDMGFAIDSTGQCYYDKEKNGGCEIGRHLPNNEARYTLGAVRDLFYDFPEYKAYFEDYDSSFWSNLQQCHDRLGYYCMSGTENSWYEFEYSLREAATLCE